MGTTKVVSNTTPNASAVLSTNIMRGTAGSANERGLEAARLALSPALLMGPNAGFLRMGAGLAILIVSDEEDHSSDTVTNYTRDLGMVQSGATKLHAIVGTQQPRCMGANGQAEYGGRYIQVANAFMGVVESICGTNWNAAFSALVMPSALRSSFRLMSAADPMSISVSVNGVLVPELGASGQRNWRYDMQSVIFERAAVPPANATIAIGYRGTC